MLIKDLKILGFKSFVDQTDLTFEPGFTGIVGPNGCGKSNISDAVRWVLGEQTAKHLRGTRMDDLIFNGSENRKPVGMASVSLTFTGVQGKITDPNFFEFDEITVTRRLFRTGESEYLINNSKCRLKDVVDLFLDTGVSNRSYSIMEQGQIAKIVNSKPEDRRVLIEEAAGIVKYKIRRHEALNKLELSAQNLDRVSDIIRELERQMTSLKRQAGKAERFKNYKSELRERLLAVFSYDFHGLKNRISQLETDLSSKQEMEVAQGSKVASIKNELEVLRHEIFQKEREVSGQKEEQVRVQGRIQGAEENLEILKEQQAFLNESLGKAKADLEQFSKEQIECTEQIEEAVRNEQKLESELETVKGLFSDQNEEFKTRKNQVEEKISHIEESERKSIGLLDQISQRENSLSSIRARSEMLEARAGKINAEWSQVTDQKEGVVERLSQQEKGLETVTRNLSSQKEELKKETKNLESLDQRLEENEEYRSALHEEITSEKAHLNSLKELDRTYQGYSDGIRVLMDARAKDENNLPGVGGVLIEVLNTTQALEVSIESILNDKLQGVIVEDHGAGLSALQILKRNSIGKQTFIPMEPKLFGSDQASSGSGLSGDSGWRDNWPDGVVGEALKLVNYPEEYDRIFRYLLHNVVIVRDIQTAISIWKQTQGEFTFVSLDGEIIDRGGVIVSGPGKNSGSGLLERKRLIQEISEKLKDLTHQFKLVQQKRGELKELREKTVITVRETEQSFREIELELVRAEHGTQKENQELDRFTRYLETLDAERTQVDMEMTSLAQEKERLGDEISNLSRERETLTETLHRDKEDLAHSRRDLETKGKELRQLEVRMVKITGNLSNHQNESNRLKKSRADLVLRSERRQQELTEMENKIAETGETIGNLRNETVNLSMKNDELLGEIRRLAEQLEEKTVSLEQVEANGQQAEQSHNQVKEEIHELGLQLTEMRLQLEYLMDKAGSEFTIEPVEIEQYPLESLNEQILEEEVKPRIDFLKQQIGKIGEVNIGAIDEYEEVSERHRFLKTQQQDLVDSSQALKETINKIGRTTKKRFEETFHQVNENFKAIFRRLFNGGRAELVLVDDSDFLETGIEIVAQPPGKKLQNLSLLSMGEKSMVAITLLFSFFMVRPSPFCLLDEVDAALDEANVVRFRDMLEELREGTQFLIITHNQKTMSFADRLYGVTMEQNGISKVLSLKLKEAMAYAA